MMRRPARPLLPLLLVMLASLLALAAPPASAAQPQTTLSAMEQQVMCVVCRTPLSVANGPQADAERRQIRELIADGRSEQQIKDVLVAQYGERVLALPRDDGFNLAVYLVPIAAVALALALLALTLPRWRRDARARAAAPAVAAPALSAEDAQRLDEDLARHE
jgi:cytochrome c-type biogenesis protein CcmH/NrfF